MNLAQTTMRQVRGHLLLRGRNALVSPSAERPAKRPTAPIATRTRSLTFAVCGRRMRYRATTSDGGPLIGDQQSECECMRFIKVIGADVPRSRVRNATNRRGFPGFRAGWVGWANPRRPGRCGWVPRRLTYASNGYVVGIIGELAGIGAGD